MCGLPSSVEINLRLVKGSEDPTAFRTLLANIAGLSRARDRWRGHVDNGGFPTSELTRNDAIPYRILHGKRRLGIRLALLLSNIA